MAIWINPKSSASPATARRVCCGEPIDLGSGKFSSRSRTTQRPGRTRSPSPATTTAWPTPDTYATGLGANWRTNYDRYLHIFNPSAIYGVAAERPDGQVDQFHSSSGTYTPDSDVDLKLTSFRQHMDADRPDDTVETYTSRAARRRCNPSSCATATRRRSLFAGGQITSVSDSYGRT